MEKFELNVDLWYHVGKDFFLTKHIPGDIETFCHHVVRYHMPATARTTYERHALGVGIFTMQGFEQRNKESKNTMHRFNNKKGNVCESNMKRLWDVFHWEKNQF